MKKNDSANREGLAGQVTSARFGLSGLNKRTIKPSIQLSKSI